MDVIGMDLHKVAHTTEMGGVSIVWVIIHK